MRLLNENFPNNKIVSNIIKELVHFRGQEWFQTKLYTYDSLATNKNYECLFISWQNSFFYFPRRAIVDMDVYNRDIALTVGSC